MLASPPTRSVFQDSEGGIGSSGVSRSWLNWFQSITGAVKTPAINSPPAHTNSAGTQGQIAFDSSGNLYVCVAANSWFKYTGSSAF